MSTIETTTIITSQKVASYTVSQKAFSQALTAVKPTVVKKSSMPILECVMLDASGTVLSVRSTNLDAEITVEVPAIIETGGKVVVNYKSLVEAVKGIQKGADITCTKEDGKLILSAKGTRLGLPLWAVDDFPYEKGCVNGASTIVNVDDLKEQAALLVESAADDSARPVLTCIRMIIDRDRIDFASADAFRMHISSIATTDTLQSSTWHETVLVNAVDFGGIVKSLAKKSRAVITVSDYLLKITQPGFKAVIRRQDKDYTYPNVERVLEQEKDHTLKVTVNRKALLNATLASTPVAKDNSNITRYTFKGSTLVVEAGVFERDKTEVSFSTEIAAAIEGEDNQMIMLNVAYMSRFLKLISDENVTIHMTSPMRPVSIKPAHGRYTYVVMPMSPNR